MESQNSSSQIVLKNNVITGDTRLDRVPHFDEKSKEYPIRQVVSTKKRRSYTWRCLQNLDQGREGACVGFGVTHELIARPSEVKGLDNQSARNLYFEAQKIDPWEGGAYPGAVPFYEGTSVIAGVKVAQSMGYFAEYRWSFGIDDLILGVGYSGPAVMGLAWFDGMFVPDEGGYIRPTGRMVGGHCILCKGISIKKNRFLMHNSWGKGWGMDGTCYIDIDDMATLLKMDGEAVFFMHRKSKPLN